jgi:hypothetical protein
MLVLVLVLVNYSVFNMFVEAEGINNNHPLGGQNDSNATIVQELAEIKPIIDTSISISIPDILSIVIPVIAAIFLFWLQQRLERRDQMRRSSDAVLKEIEETRDALVSEQEKRIRYNIVKLSESKNNIKGHVDYRNIYLNTDAYDSILHSGLFTNFSVETQHTLSKLYSRIRSHDDLITYLQHFRDAFLINNVTTEDKEKRWKGESQPYELTLTEWEKEIIHLAYVSTFDVLSEKPRRIFRTRQGNPGIDGSNPKQ